VRLGRRDFGPSLDLLVVGLGNPGPEYAATRHNLGFMVTDRLAAEWTLGWKSKFSGRVAEGRDGDVRLALLQPLTYMNVSGKSVAAAMRFYKLDTDALVVVHDEIDLDLGDVRAKSGGGLAGHNGLRSLRDTLGTADFVRVRIGVGRPERGERQPVADWVLRPFPADVDERCRIERGCDRLSGRIGFERVGQQRQVPIAVDVDGPERLEVIGAPLHVEQRHPALAHQLHQEHQRHFRCVTLQVEHRLAGEQPVDPHAVEAARELPLPIEDFDAVRPTERVQLGKGLNDLGGDPRPLARGIPASPDDVDKAGVDADAVSPGALLHRPGDPKRIERQDATGIGRPPGQYPSGRLNLHRKQPLAIRGDECRRLEVGADGDEIVFWPLGRRGKRPSIFADGARARLPISQETVPARGPWEAMKIGL